MRYYWEQGVPKIEEARRLLKEAAQLNPGLWVEHSINTGIAAKLIAENCPNMDPNIALVLGMLHDIGRRFGITVGISDIPHCINGFRFASERGYPLLAKICLTHSMKFQDLKADFGIWDCSEEDYKYIRENLKFDEFDDYDILIQLCDAVSVANGFCLLEKRMVDVVLRHGVPDSLIWKWQETFKTKKYFEEKMGKSIYSILPKVMENTFDIS